MPLFLPSDWKNRSHTTEWGRARTGQVSKQGLVVQTEYLDGRKDVTVKPRAMRLAIRPQSGGHLSAVLAFEKAVREHEMACRSADVGWRKRTAAAVELAKQRVIERQG